MEEVVWEAVTRFRRQYPEFAVRIQIPDELLLVEMDAVLIEQVILNLLINAAVHGQTADSAVVSVERKHGSFLTATDCEKATASSGRQESG